MQITYALINDLKAKGHYFAAGAVAASLEAPRSYGCHFGMRSELEGARREFERGYDEANRN